MMKLLTLLYALSLLPGLILSQDLGIPGSWRKPSNSRKLNERISISQNAINRIMPTLDVNTGEFKGIGYWQSGNVWTAMANQDRYARTNVNRDAVIRNLNKVFGLRANFDRYGYNDDALWWAQASIAAYRAYKDRAMLSHAVAVWNSVSAFAITPDEAKAKKHPGKDFVTMYRCEEKTMAGGVFWRPTRDDKSINSITTGLFMTTSALLAELTGEAKYRESAILSAEWIRNHNINKNNIVMDSVHANDCVRSPSTWLFTYNSGKYVEGLSVLADVTKDNKWRDLMLKIVSGSVRTTAWQGADGIVSEGASRDSNNDGVGFKAVYIRGLYEAFARNPQNTGLRTLLHSYIDVQYNALLDLARKDDSYSAKWHGPPQDFNTWGQLAALDVLSSAIITNN